VNSSIHSSTSSSSANPTISVVVGAKASTDSLRACLSALEPQRAGVEVVVCEALASPPELRERFHWAAFTQKLGALVPELWTEGIDQASGDVVALTISQMVPASDWIEAIRDQHRRHDAVGGAIDPGKGLRIADWAEYFCRYSRDMAPFPGHACVDLPGDNAAYKREWLDRVRSTFRDGFWEPDVHRELANEGASLWHAPEVVVRQGGSAGWRAFASQRLRHGRAYGNQRGVRFGRARNAAGVAGAPLVPFLMTLRIFRQVYAKRRHRTRAVAALPLIFFFNVVWAAAEARGHLDILARR
jgi:hypothetical protein